MCIGQAMQYTSIQEELGVQIQLFLVVQVSLYHVSLVQWEWEFLGSQMVIWAE